MIPDEAVEAAAKEMASRSMAISWDEIAPMVRQIRTKKMRAALEAAAPILLSHEREETRLAHLDAVVNAASVSKYEALVDELRHISDNKTADNTIGRWWANVIRGTIDKHLNGGKQ